jgi:DNA-binding response OmpR family regulator
MTEEKIKKIILIVDDDPAILKMLADKLILEGFDILQATDGEEGFKMACNNNPDLILLDIIMPKMDGLTMMKKLRQTNEWGKNVPIILLTNLSPDDDKINKSVTEDTPAFYLLKPNWGIDDVIKKIREALGEKIAII